MDESLIRLEGVSRHYGVGPSRSTALDDVSLTVRAGEFVAISGPSGSGKTTLLNLIGALDAPSSGRILLGGRDLGALGAAELADLRLERLGFVFQQFNLVPVLSAAENVELPLLFRRGLGGEARRRAAAAWLDRVGLAGKARRRPGELSGGEQQRVAVARALAGGPAIVLADEPTANLDHATGAGIIDLMRGLNSEAGTTFVYATHDAELVRRAGRVVVLRDGRLDTEPAS
jgi:putative ABC transport system ATP-binding protein